jgi:hypothetical protein
MNYMSTKFKGAKDIFVIFFESKYGHEIANVINDSLCNLAV